MSASLLSSLWGPHYFAHARERERDTQTARFPLLQQKVPKIQGVRLGALSHFLTSTYQKWACEWYMKISLSYTFYWLFFGVKYACVRTVYMPRSKTHYCTAADLLLVLSTYSYAPSKTDLAVAAAACNPENHTQAKKKTAPRHYFFLPFCLPATVVVNRCCSIYFCRGWCAKKKHYVWGATLEALSVWKQPTHSPFPYSRHRADLIKIYFRCTARGGT